MRVANMLTVLAALALLPAACGKDDEQARAGSGGEGGNSRKGSSMPAPPDCSEKNAITVTWGEDADPKPPAFEHKSTTAYLTGMRYNGKADAKLATVVFANAPTKFTMFGLDTPKGEGETHLVVAFKTAHHEHEVSAQKQWYVAANVEAGDYEPGWMDPEPIVQISYFLGGSDAAPALSSSDSTGGATITKATAGGICGTIDLETPRGSAIEGTFNVAYEKDLWADL